MFFLNDLMTQISFRIEMIAKPPKIQIIRMYCLLRILMVKNALAASKATPFLASSDVSDSVYIP